MPKKKAYCVVKGAKDEDRPLLAFFLTSGSAGTVTLSFIDPDGVEWGVCTISSDGMELWGGLDPSSGLPLDEEGCVDCFGG